MNKRDVLETLINYYCEGNKAKFASMVGITPQLLSNWIKRDTLDYEQVYSGCPNLSGDWLLSGEGNIERNNAQTQDKQNDNRELLHLCLLLVENYQQRDIVMNKLVSMVNKMKK